MQYGSKWVYYLSESNLKTFHIASIGFDKQHLLNIFIKINIYLNGRQQTNTKDNFFLMLYEHLFTNICDA